MYGSSMLKGILPQLQIMREDVEKINSTITLTCPDYYTRQKAVDSNFEALEKQGLELTLDYILKTYYHKPFFKMLEEIHGAMLKQLCGIASCSGHMNYSANELGHIYRVFEDPELSDTTEEIYNLNITNYSRVDKKVEETLSRLMCGENSRFYDGATVFMLDNDRILSIYEGCTYADGPYPYWFIRVVSKQEANKLLDDYRASLNALAI